MKLVHDKVRPHRCDVCHKTFTLKGTIDRHKLVHSGVKPHECKLFDSKFAHSTDPTKHIANVRDKLRPYKF